MPGYNAMASNPGQFGNPGTAPFLAANRVLNFTEIVGLQWIDKYGQHWVVDEEGIPNRMGHTFLNNNTLRQHTIHQTCYCQQRLIKCDADGRPCESCRKTTRHVMFACPAYNQCFFYNGFARQFVICWDCC